jgi:hypothetical protein
MIDYQPWGACLCLIASSMGAMDLHANRVETGIVSQLVGESNPKHELPIGPWSHTYERGLGDHLGGLVPGLAQRIMSLDSAELSNLSQLVADYQARLEAKLPAWRVLHQEWDARVRNSELAETDAMFTRLEAEREAILAPVADEQASMEQEFIEALRARFEEKHSQKWKRFEYELLFATARAPGAHIPTGSVDLVGILEATMATNRSATGELGDLQELTALHCERFVRIARELKAWRVKVDRGTSRRFWEQAQRESLASESRRNTALFRSSDALHLRIGTAASALAELNLTSADRLCAALPSQEGQEFRLRFWSATAERSALVFWPRSLMEFRARLQELATDEKRTMLAEIFAAEFNNALKRVAEDEKWARRIREDGYRGDFSARSSEAAELLRRQQKSCAALNALCKRASELIGPAKLEGVRVPNFHIAIPEVIR